MNTSIINKINNDGYFNYEFTFTNLIKCAYNEKVVESAFSIADDTIDKHLAPIIILGKSGMGKTHIMQSIYYATSNKKRVKYCTANQFISELVESIKTNLKENFITSYSSLDLLLIEDIDDFEEKGKTQDRLIQIIDYLINNGKIIVFSTSKRPADLNISNKLKSRLLGGNIIVLKTPTQYDIEHLIKQKAIQLKIELNKKDIKKISSRKYQDIRELIGAIAQNKI